MAGNIILETNAILLRNRNVLQEIYMRGKTRINTVELIERDFDFEHHTHQLRHQDIEQVFKFSYDYGIGKLKDDYFVIIRLPIEDRYGLGAG